MSVTQSALIFFLNYSEPAGSGNYTEKDDRREDNISESMKMTIEQKVTGQRKTAGARTRHGAVKRA